MRLQRLPVIQEDLPDAADTSEGLNSLWMVSLSAILGLTETFLYEPLTTAVTELSRSPPEHRIAFITNACQILDHYDIQDHNSELSLGVATVLVNRIQATSQQEEVRMLVSALEMVLRATTQSLQIAYEAWPPKFLERLSSLLESYETQRGIPHAEISSLNLLKILTSLARVADLKPVLLKTPGMRSILLRLNRQQHRVPRLKLLHQLVQNETNQVHVLTHETTLTNLILHIAHHDNDASRQYSAAIIMELASSSLSNQTQMAHDDKMLDTITKLVLTEVQAGTREAVLTALQNIAFVHENRMRLVTYKKGIVLQALQTSLTNGNDYSKARRRAAGALTNLACDATSTIMANHEGLLDALAVTSTSGKVDEVQTRASLALTKIAGGLSVSMDCFPAILDALVVASLSPSAGNVAAMLRLKARLPENRSAMAQHPGLLDTLADLSHGPHRNHAVRALMHLANESSNHPLLGHVPSILHALVKAGGADDDEDSRDCALVALERLALTASIRPHLARHEGLLTMVARAVEREAHEPQQEDKNYLAKPLLMSLLVAM